MNRLEALRHEMRSEGIDAIIIPSSDPHNSEYVAPHWQSRSWISGFDGSAGTAVVTLDEEALWTDSRYFLQAERQLSERSAAEGCRWQLMKEGLQETPTIIEWLMRKMSSGGGTTVAIDGMLMTYADALAMQKEFSRIGVTLRTNYDAMRMVWHDRPCLPMGEIYVKPTGETVTEKLSRIRACMQREHCDAHVLADLMGIAWTLNLRGSDVKQTPVFVAYLYVGQETATLFCADTLTAEARQAMKQAGVDVRPYETFAQYLRECDGSRIMVDSSSTSYTLYNIIKAHAIDMPSPVIAFKAVKNAYEIEGMRQSMLRDGVAMVKFLRWLKPAVERGGETEISVSDKLESLRRESTEFRDLSFSTICGYNAHGAIVHYSATPETDMPLKPEGLLLVDSGAQYTDGTTDITRTIPLGPLTDEMRRAYTLVLKAHIALAMSPFPDGTCGTQIDALARAEVWRGGMNYLHGTGHGVGWCLAVHEGPHSIRMDWRPAPLHEGMTVTDEPGVYVAGAFGIRTENTMLVTRFDDLPPYDGVPFLRLEPLTLCPIPTEPIVQDMLTPVEVDYLNDYHARVERELMPLLEDEADRQWLKQACGAV